MRNAIEHPLADFPIGWIPVVNTDSEPVPPYGVVEIKSISDSDGIARVGKPSRSGQTNVFFNGRTPIPGSGSGGGSSGNVHCTFPAITAYQGDDGTDAQPAHDDVWGTVASSWYLHKHQPGFRVIGVGSVGNCNVVRDFSSLSLSRVKVTSDLGSGVYQGKLATYTVAGGWSDGATIRIKDPNGNPLKINAYGHASFIETSGGVDYYLGTADLWDDGACP